ncbi:MAG: ABC transporter permease subunit [Candidatus Latescibacteria bacterium]|jgi:ABC-type transport system involved in multi-copper enzyme maturation permease subunit|nr:ABC transporter permease subunit [Candidatus Latescibacterota bacterium]
MFATLILKEIQETIHTHRFFIAVLLCLVLIPTGTYVTLKDYQQRYNSYQNAERMYHERSEGKIKYDFRAEGYRPPSELSIFSIGLEYTLPNKIMTSRDGRFELMNDSVTNISQSTLFGKIDFYFIVSFVLSLLAMIFTFSSVTGEKESATLRLMLSNSVPRWTIIMAKILGNYLVFLVPFVVSLLLMVLIISVSVSFDIFSSEVLPKVLVIYGAAFMFLLAMFTLGTLVSTFTSKSLTSMVILLLVWVIFILVVPKLSPMLAEALHPVKSQQVFSMEKRIISESIVSDYRNRLRALLGKIASDFSITDEMAIFGFSRVKPENSESALKSYNEEKISIDEEFHERLGSEMKKFEELHKNEIAIQNTISRMISRISPVSCFAYSVSELSGTGMLELDNIEKNARVFQHKVNEDIYNNYNPKEYFTTNGSHIYNPNKDEAFDETSASVPHMDTYRRISLTETIKAAWIDILLLALYSILFFAGSFVSFLRYDVR